MEHAVYIQCIFLCEYLSLRELFLVGKEDKTRIAICSPKWLRGRIDTLNSMKVLVTSILDQRLSVADPLPFPFCQCTTAWLAKHCAQPVSSAFRPIRSWLSHFVGWANAVESRSKRKIKSAALF